MPSCKPSSPASPARRVVRARLAPIARRRSPAHTHRVRASHRVTIPVAIVVAIVVAVVVVVVVVRASLCDVRFIPGSVSEAPIA